METEAALKGVKVANFCWLVTGNIIGKYLAEHGAEIIQIESSRQVDLLRTSPPYKDGKAGLNRSVYFANFHFNERGIVLNLRHPQGLELAKRLIAWADIVMESFTPGAMERLGLDYTEVRKVKPDIIMVSTSIQGQSGPYATLKGTGNQLTALAGISYLTGFHDEAPQNPCGPITDVMAGHLGAAAVMCALDYRRRTGKGQYIDLCQIESSIQFLAPEVLDFSVNSRIAKRRGNRCPYAAPHGAYPCKMEDEWCVIAVSTDREWKSFRNVLGNPLWTTDTKFSTLLGRKENENELDRLVSEWTMNYAAEEIMTKMQAQGISAGIVRDGKDLYEDPQLIYRQHFRELMHPEIGSHKCDSPPFKLSKTPSRANRAAPCLGQDNEYVCCGILGLGDEEFVSLVADGVFE